MDTIRIENKIKEKSGSLVGNMASQGTTPRQLTDLIGSLCDLTSGSGDKGTPVVLVQDYFTNYSQNAEEYETQQKLNALKARLVKIEMEQQNGAKYYTIEQLEEEIKKTLYK